MNPRLLAALLLAAAPALSAQGPSTEEWSSLQSNLEGLYAGIGGGGNLLIIPGDNAFGYDAELRLGYSFNPVLQIYVSGSADGARFSGRTFRSGQIVAFVQYHLLVKPAVMVYGRGGIGVGLSRDVVPDSTAVGLAEAGGLGVEIRVAPNLFLGPELFYRNASLSTQGIDQQLHTIGLQLALVYY